MALHRKGRVAGEHVKIDSGIGYRTPSDFERELMAA